MSPSRSTDSSNLPSRPSNLRNPLSISSGLSQGMVRNWLSDSIIQGSLKIAVPVISCGLHGITKTLAAPQPPPSDIRALSVLSGRRVFVIETHKLSDRPLLFPQVSASSHLCHPNCHKITSRKVGSAPLVYSSDVSPRRLLGPGLKADLVMRTLSPAASWNFPEQRFDPGPFK